MKKYIDLSIIIIVLLASILLIKFSRIVVPSPSNDVVYEQARVITINKELLQTDPLFKHLDTGYQDIQIEIITGKYKGEKYNIRNSMSRLYNVKTKEGMTIIASIYLKDNKIEGVGVYSHKRNAVLFALVALFFLVLFLVGGKKGLKSILALIFTCIMIIFYLLPSIFNGKDPITSAVITVAIVTIVSLLLISGRSKKTVAAMIGTILGVIIAGVIAHFAGELSQISGLTLQDADDLIFIAERYGINIKGLMFVSILVGSLGAMMDMGMSIASSIFEMHKLKSDIQPKELFKAGMNVGKDVIGTMTNTLILAFAGSSLNLIIFIMAAQMSYNQLTNLDIMSVELIQSLAGSIGIVLTVPITALASVLLIKGEFNSKSSTKVISTKKLVKKK